MEIIINYSFTLKMNDHRARKDTPPDETLNSGLGSAVAQISLQLSLQVLNLHQLARHIVEHPERLLISNFKLCYL